MYILRSGHFLFYEDDFGGQAALYLNNILFSLHESCIALESAVMWHELRLRAPLPGLNKNSVEVSAPQFYLGYICTSFQRMADTENSTGRWSFRRGPQIPILHSGICFHLMHTSPTYLAYVHFASSLVP